MYKVSDPDVRQFIEKCLATVSHRLSARELLDDPFLQADDVQSDLSSLDYREVEDIGSLSRQCYLELPHSYNSLSNGHSNDNYEAVNQWSYHSAEAETTGIELFEYHDDDHSSNVDVSIKGKKSDDGGIFLRLRIADKEGSL